jgi:hypothetical protein
MSRSVSGRKRGNSKSKRSPKRLSRSDSPVKRHKLLVLARLCLLVLLIMFFMHKISFLEAIVNHWNVLDPFATVFSWIFAALTYFKSLKD